jgi:thioredoxin-related protein
MTPHELLHTIKTKGKEHIVIFSANGDWCKWCNRLKEILKDKAFETYLQENNISLLHFPLDRKDVDTSGAREFFQIKSLPTLVYIDELGATQSMTEFLDEAESQGSGVYTQWLKPLRPNKLDW